MDDLHDFTARLGPWHGGDGPLYRQLAAAIQRLLESGGLDTGMALPPQRRLALALSVSRNTVAAAYAELRRDGWLDAKRGSATTVVAVRHSQIGAHKANPIFAMLLRDHPGVLDMTVAVPNAAPIVASVLGDPAAHMPDVGVLHEGHGYYPAGHPALRNALAEQMSNAGLQTEPNEILITSGAQQGISLVMRALLRPGDVVGMEEVTFPGALDALSSIGGRTAPIEMGPSGLNVDSAERVVEHDRPRLLYVVPTFQNPTGTLLEGSDRARLARLIAGSNTSTIDDVTLSDLDHGSTTPPHLAAFEPDAPIITVGSMSKVFWGGLRVGWVRARPAVIAHLAGIKATSDLGSNASVQAAAVTILRHREETRSWRKAALARSLAALGEALAQRLPEWEWEAPVGGPYLWIRLPNIDASAFVQLAVRHGVIAVAGPLLASAPNVALDRIRLPFYLEPEKLELAVHRLSKAWASRSSGLDLRHDDQESA